MAHNHSMDYLTSLIYNQATPVEESLTAEEVAGEIEEAKSKKVGYLSEITKVLLLVQSLIYTN